MSTRAITLTKSGTELEHERFCLPRPDEKAVRIETFEAARYADDGLVAARPLVTRCMECGAQVVEEPTS